MGLLERQREIPRRVMATFSAAAAENLRVLLRTHGITNRELAYACARSESWVGKRINGQIPMDLDDLEVVARALGVEPADLLPRGWVAPSPDPGNDGDAAWAPRGSNPQPADYKFHSSVGLLTLRSDAPSSQPVAA